MTTLGIKFTMASGPDFRVLSSTENSTVRVRVIDTTTKLGGIPAAAFLAPQFPGMSNLDGPSFSFLIEHSSSRNLIFDLGVRKDWENLPAPTVKRMKSMGIKADVQMGVREQLEAHGVDAKTIEAVIWSHWHWDHTGDPSTFEKSTALVVGPGFKKNFLPGYPADESGRILESDYAGRELREISFDQGLKFGRFDAFDYFGDGSFYLLDSPGHAIGHICGLARVTSSPSSFILMGGDICHHVGQFRPSPHHPLPLLISPNPFDRQSVTPCPGEMFERLLPNQDRTKPFYTVPRPQNGVKVGEDVEAAEASIIKLQETDGLSEVLVVIAHDRNVLPVIDFFPKYADDFLEMGWAKHSRWLFLKDFVEAVKS